MNEFIFTYTSKATKKVVASLRFGFQGEYIKINSKQIDEDDSFLANAPPNIKQAIKNGHNCAKENNPDACNPKCAYIRFQLDDLMYTKCRHLNFNIPIAAVEDREYVKTWLTHEMA
ncbi:MAG: hypothetical protein FWC71_09660 [Defluviitaleaceae bacterium]|nr:hypothetical protein [Defluviitaleaceae bacterium]